jgi:hypothetical protein
VHAERHILGDGGEGIMLRLPCSFYYHGRSTSLLKWKVLYYFLMGNISLPPLFSIQAALGDKEALVVSAGPTYNLLMCVYFPILVET